MPERVCRTVGEVKNSLEICSTHIRTDFKHCERCIYGMTIGFPMCRHDLMLDAIAIIDHKNNQVLLLVQKLEKLSKKHEVKQ
jgi:hypothetical protein